jgi:hypothetical protein
MSGGMSRLRLPRAALLGLLSALGCEAIAGYNDVEPRPSASGGASGSGGSRSGGAGGSSATGGSGDTGGAGGSSGASGSGGAGGNTIRDASSEDQRVTDAKQNDVTTDRALVDAEAGACTMLTGADPCISVQRFTAAAQVIDGVGDEFCNIRAVVLDVDNCPTNYPKTPPALPERAYLRVAWSMAAIHLHVHVDDPLVQPNLSDDRIWDGDAVELFVTSASGSGLHGSYDGTSDNGAIQIIMAPPTPSFPANARAFFNDGTSNIAVSNVAGRLVPGGYEIEIRFPWVVPPAGPSSRIALNLSIDARDVTDGSGGRQLECILSDVFVDGQSACGFSAGTAAKPYCDDRSWCQPTLAP